MKKQNKNVLDKSILVDGELPPEAREVYEKSFAESYKDVEDLIEENRKCEQLTADDFNIRINC